MGAVLFAGASYAMVVVAHSFAENLLYLLYAPAEWLNHFTGRDQASATSFVNSDTFAVIVNGFLGVIIFTFIASCKQLGMKSDQGDEN